MNPDPAGGQDFADGVLKGLFVQMLHGFFQIEHLLIQKVRRLKGIFAAAGEQGAGHLAGRAFQMVLFNDNVFQLFKVLAAQVSCETEMVASDTSHFSGQLADSHE